MDIREDDIEDVLAKYCAPVLFGEKPAALIGRHAMPQSCIRGKTRLYEYGLCTERFVSRSGQVMFLIYRANKLSDTLSQADVSEGLSRLGYPDARICGCAGMLRELRRRFRESKGFPHEIGFFLGYPAEDVIGFMTDRGDGCKFCGPWKVYGDVESAKKRFKEFARMKNMLASIVESGGSIRLFCSNHMAQSRITDSGALNVKLPELAG
jgi:hypothetical protein